MKYLRSYQYIFDNPQWTMNVLLGAVCSLSTAVVPVVGQIVFSGYAFIVLEAMHRRGADSTYPDFDFNNLVKYLVRGLWPFIIHLIFGLVLGVFIGAFVAIFMVAIFATMDADEPNLVVLIGGMFLYTLAVVVLSFLAQMLALPLVLRAGLSQELNVSASVQFYKDFARRVMKEWIVSQLFILATALPLTFLGLALCCVGHHAVIPVVGLANIHLMYQLYGLYLERGGTPIPLKEDREADPNAPGPASPTVAAEPPDANVTRRPGEPPDARISGSPEA